METIKKLKGELKRLRQDLILKGSSKRRDEDEMSDDSGLDEEEKAAIRMLQPEHRKMLAELE